MASRKKLLRAAAFLLALCLLLPCVPVQRASAVGFDVTVDMDSAETPYTDVNPEQWFYKTVGIQYRLGLMQGTGPETFSPERQVSVYEVLQAAVRLHVLYYGETYCGRQLESFYGTSSPSFSVDPVYAVVERARGYKICGKTEYGSLLTSRRIASRAETVTLLAQAVSASVFEKINTISCVPDRTSACAYLEQDVEGYRYIKRFYEAGILSGTNSSRDFRSDKPMTRAELAAVLNAIVLPELRTRFRILSHRSFCGFSGSWVATGGREGQPLHTYRIGDGKNVLLLTYAIHGNEGSGVPGDGAVLSRLGESVRSYLEKTQLQKNGNWTVWLIPACNPDGIANDGPFDAGRRTSYRYSNDTRKHLVDNGIVSGGIDLNRCFPSSQLSKFYGITSARGSGSQYYTGTFPMGAPEAEYLAAFAEKIKGPGINLLIDTHGWYTQLLGPEPAENRLLAVFRNYFYPDMREKNKTAPGYWTDYVCTDLGYTETLLVELPEKAARGAASTEEIWNNLADGGWNKRYLDAIAGILLNY